jgi:hypothetical protein
MIMRLIVGAFSVYCSHARASGFRLPATTAGTASAGPTSAISNPVGPKSTSTTTPRLSTTTSGAAPNTLPAGSTASSTTWKTAGSGSFAWIPEPLVLLWEEQHPGVAVQLQLSVAV